MTTFYLVQHGEKEPVPGDPGLTGHGWRQAAHTGRWLRDRGLTALFTSPLRRAGETAQVIAAATGVTARVDARLRERMNWDGVQPLETFLADWAATVADRDVVPRSGDSSRTAGERLRGFLAEWSAGTGVIAVVTHGGVTVDLLRTLLGDDRVAPGLLHAGVPPCALTTLHDLTVRDVAAVAHL